MKDIGSIFPIFEDGNHKAEINRSSIESYIKKKDEINYYSLCREAIFDIARNSYIKRKVLLPDYTCHTVIEPFKQLGYEIYYYNVEKDLRIDIINLRTLIDKINPGILFVHPFYGADLNSDENAVLFYAKKKGAYIILDLTQCLFSSSNYEYVDFYIGSIRKWIGIPDGAFISYKKGMVTHQAPKDEYKKYVNLQLASMSLRGEYFNTGNEVKKQESRELQKQSDACANEPIKPHRISDYSLQVLLNTDYNDLITKRLDNYNYLYENLNYANNEYNLIVDKEKVTSPPLYLPIYCSNRDIVQKKLAKAKIYAPILWLVEDNEVLQYTSCKYIYESILALPCDQRYDRDDLARIVTQLRQ